MEYYDEIPAGEKLEYDEVDAISSAVRLPPASLSENLKKRVFHVQQSPCTLLQILVF